MSDVDLAAVTAVHATWVDDASADDVDLARGDFSDELRSALGTSDVEVLQDEGAPLLVVAWLTSDPPPGGVDAANSAARRRFGEHVSADSGFYPRRSFFGDPARTPGTLVFRLYVEDDALDEARGWADEEHSQRQLTVPGAHNFQGFEPTRPGGPLLNLWGLDDVAISTTEAWTSLRASPRRDALWPSVVNAVPGAYQQR